MLTDTIRDCGSAPSSVSGPRYMPVAGKERPSRTTRMLLPGYIHNPQQPRFNVSELHTQYRHGGPHAWTSHTGLHLRRIPDLLRQPLYVDLA